MGDHEFNLVTSIIDIPRTNLNIQNHLTINMLRFARRGFVVIQIEAVEMITGELRPRASTAPRRVIRASSLNFLSQICWNFALLFWDIVDWDTSLVTGHRWRIS